MATGGVPLQQLTCSICLDVFSSPATLPCAHSFCRGCIHTYWEKGDISCPLCLTRFPHRPALSVNLIMEEMASGLRLQDQPLVPDPNPDSLVQSVSDSPPPPDRTMAAGQNKVMCSRHHQEMTLFCVDDNSLLCGQCADHHKTHTTVPAAEQMPQIQMMLRNEKTRTASIARNIKMDILKTQMNIETFKDSVTLQKEELEVDLSRLISAITDVKRRLMASMEEKEKRLLQKSQSEVTKMEATCKTLEDEVSNMDADLKSMDPYRVMQAYNSLQRRSSHASAIQSSDGVTFDPEEKLTESRDIREQLMTAVTSIWKDQGPIAAQPLDIDLTSFILNPPLSKLIKYSESLTFDLTTAASFIWVSPDRTVARNTSPEVQPQEPHPERLEDNRVRATQSFTGGRHFWQVTFSHTTAYFGILSNQTSRGVLIYPYAISKNYMAFEVWSSEVKVEQGNINVPHSMFKNALCCVYLDYDSGILGLYYRKDNTDDLHPLHTFTTNFNKDVIFPIFQVAKNTVRFT